MPFLRRRNLPAAKLFDGLRIRRVAECKRAVGGMAAVFGRKLCIVTIGSTEDAVISRRSGDEDVFKGERENIFKIFGAEPGAFSGIESIEDLHETAFVPAAKAIGQMAEGKEFFVAQDGYGDAAEKPAERLVPGRLVGAVENGGEDFGR